jgi:prevent-host-death family protein
MGDLHTSMSWSLQDAKARFSELVNRSIKEGVQTVTRHGKPAVVVISWDQYREMVKKTKSFRAFLESAPRVDLDIEREEGEVRELIL